MVPVAICGQDGVVLPTRQLIPVGILPGVIRLEIARGALQCPFERRVAARTRTLQPGVEIGAVGPREQATTSTNRNRVRRRIARRVGAASPVPDGVETYARVLAQPSKRFRSAGLGLLVAGEGVLLPVGEVLQFRLLQRTGRSEDHTSVLHSLL